MLNMFARKKRYLKRFTNKIEEYPSLIIGLFIVAIMITGVVMINSRLNKSAAVSEKS